MSREKIINIVQGIVVVLFFIGVLVIGLYPFANRDLVLKVETTDGSQMISLSASAIAENEKIALSFDEENEINIKSIYVYRDFASVRIYEINYVALPAYIEDIQNGEMHFLDDCLVISGSDGVHFSLSESESTVIRGLSQSYIVERIVLIAWWFAFCIFAVIACNIVGEKTGKQKTNNHGMLYDIRKFFVDLGKYRQYIVFAAKADLKAEVADSYLNRLWWLLEPFFSMMVYVIVFGKVMGRAIDNYATYIFSALLMWSFFNKTINYSVKLVRNNKDIVSKVYVPKSVLLISNMVLNFYKLLFSLIVLLPMLIIFKVDIGVNIFGIIPAYVLMILFSFGIGMFFLHFGVYIDDLAYAVGKLLNMLMFLSGTFYDVITGLPTPLNQIMLAINPVALFIDTMRNALLYNRMDNVPLICVWIVLSLLISWVGIHVVYKNENGYVKVV